MRGSEYAELAAFASVVRERSFRRAAARLGLSPSALSHAIRALEERLGSKLLNRTTRSVAPTEAGSRLFARLGPAFADIAEAVSEVRAVGERATGTLRINLPAFAASMVLGPALHRFVQAHPGVHLDLVVDDGLTDIVADGFDAGIRPGERVQRDMIAVRVSPDLATTVVGAPAYLATRPAPRTPRDLREHACINYRFAKSGALYRWPFARGKERFEVAVEGPVTFNDAGLVVAAALDGVGLAFTLADGVVTHVATGRLISVLPDWCPTLPGFYLYYPGRRQMPAALRALVEMLRTGEP